MNCRCGSKETVTDLMTFPDHTCAACALTACGARPHLLCSPGAACSFTCWGPGDRGRKRGLPAHLHAGAQETEEESVPTALLTLQMQLSLSASTGTYARGKYITDFTAYLHKNCYLKISKRKQKEAQNVVLVQQWSLAVLFTSHSQGWIRSGSTQKSARICTQPLTSFRACSCHQPGAHNQELLGSGST